MTPRELQQALTAMPPRSAQTLMFRCVDGRTPAECAALYGIGVPQWELLFLDAARALAGEAGPLDDADRVVVATLLQRGLESGAETPALAPLRALTEHRVEVQALLAEAERAAAASPARHRELWLRRIAVAAIIAVSVLIWLRDRDKPPEPPTRPHAR